MKPSNFLKWLFVAAIVMLVFKCACTNNSKPSDSKESDYETTEVDTVATRKMFTLTSLMGKELSTPAKFYVEGSKWELDTGDESIFYTIISGDKYNPMCGLNAVDSNGDECEICITKLSDRSTVSFEYAAGKMTYEGRYGN